MTGSPHAAFHRRSKVTASTVSLSDKPCSACSLIHAGHHLSWHTRATPTCRKQIGKHLIGKHHPPMRCQETKNTVGLQKMTRDRLRIQHLTLIIRPTLHPKVIPNNTAQHPDRHAELFRTRPGRKSTVCHLRRPLPSSRTFARYATHVGGHPQLFQAIRRGLAAQVSRLMKRGGTAGRDDRRPWPLRHRDRSRQLGPWPWRTSSVGSNDQNLWMTLGEAA